MTRAAVVAIGGSSLIRDRDYLGFQEQLETVRETCIHIASMIEHGCEAAITHGNGRQVGFILMRSEMLNKRYRMSRWMVVVLRLTARSAT